MDRAIARDHEGRRPVLLRTNMGAGHGGASGRFNRLDEVAIVYAFALWAVGLAEASAEGQGALPASGFAQVFGSIFLVSRASKTRSNRPSALFVIPAANPGVPISGRCPLVYIIICGALALGRHVKTCNHRRARRSENKRPIFFNNAQPAWRVLTNLNSISRLRQ